MKNKLIALSALTLITGCVQMDSAKLVGGPSSLPKIEAIIMPSKCAEVLDKAEAKKDESIIQVRLRNEVVDKVIEEIKGKSDIINFWSNLSPQVSKELLLNLSVSLGPEIVQSSRIPLQAVAYVFDEIQRTGIKDVAYQIKTKDGLTYSYEIRGEAIESISRISQKCTDKSMDVSKVVLPAITKKVSEIQETYRCKVKNLSVDLIRMQDTSFIVTSAENIEVPNKDIKEKENNRKIVLKINTKEVQLTLKFKKKRDRELDEVEGKKTKIDIRTALTDVKGTGVCDFMTEK